MKGIQHAVRAIGAMALCGLVAAPAMAQAKPLTKHWGTIYAVAFSPDGRRVASASAKHLEVHDAATGRRLSRVGLSHGPRCLAFAADGERVVVDANLVDVSSEQVVQTFARGGQRVLNAVAVAPDGKTVAVAPQKGPALLLATADGQLLHRLEVAEGTSVTSLSFSPDSTTLATASGSKVRLWSTRWGRSVGEMNSALSLVRAMAFSPDGAHVAVAGTGHEVELWDATHAKRLRTAKTNEKISIVALAFTRDGKTLIGGGSGSRLRRWHGTTLASRDAIAWGGRGTVTALAIAPDGRSAAIGDSRGTVRVIGVPR